jgi:hypothetical protein
MKNCFAKKLLAGTVAAAAAIVWVAPASAVILDDVQPPPWRGATDTTSEYWLFNQPTTDGVRPDGSLGQPWLPSTQITVEPLGNTWIASDPVSGRIGLWPLSGRMTVTVDNYPKANPVKWMWVQVVWHDEENMCATGPILYGFEPWGTAPEAVGPVDLGQGWNETTYKWFIYPNPREESFILAGNIKVDALIIDTWCTIPEPSAMLLAALGGGLLVVPRLRRQR